MRMLNTTLLYKYIYVLIRPAQTNIKYLLNNNSTH